jgi:hypothetical protein
MNMLDEYGLRLLEEIGVDVYAPRQATVAPAIAQEATVADPVRAIAKPLPNASRADVLILGFDESKSRLKDDLLRAFRSVQLRAELSSAVDTRGLFEARSLVVLGEPMARRLGADMPTGQHKAINWVITSDPSALALSASAKQGLWGEIKRLLRTLRANRSLE